MAPQDLEGETLGEKHRNYNYKLREAQISLAEHDDNDLNNLLKIDIACQNKDVDYVLNVLRGDDMLYISRVIKRSPWLITDNEYANIINPDYLQSYLFPNMSTKAIVKLKKHIRLNLKDENRAEQFHLKETNKIQAFKWLPNCSVAFIENHIESYLKSPTRSALKLRLFKRLCEKSITIFEIILKNLERYERAEYLKVVTFLLNTNVDKYLDVMESTNHGYPKLNLKATELIMKHSKTRITDKMEKYISIIHIPTLVKYLKADEIKKFLVEQAKKNLDNFEYRQLRQLFQYNTLKHFINRLPRNEQFDFVKNVCMHKGNKETDKVTLRTDSEFSELSKICDKYNTKCYDWYQFAQFDTAFDEITKLISQNAEPDERWALLSVLIKCTKYNLKHIQMVLDYYKIKHSNEDISSKTRFVTEIINNTYIPKYDEKTWNILNGLFKSLNVYDTSSDAPSTKIYVTSLPSTDSDIVKCIVIYNALNDIKTAEVIEKQFVFNTLKSYRSKMNENQQKKVFNYLYDHINSKLNSSVVNENDFRDSITTLKKALMLLNDWDKTLLDYPSLLYKIKELIKLKKENLWTTNLSPLYNINKSWRKHMFEESVELCPSEEVCLNALKHDPQLLVRHRETIDALKKEDKVPLDRLLFKLRLYWPHSLSQEWVDDYLNNINSTKGQKSAVRGICVMLSQKPLLDIIEKYKPIQPKIDWKQTDDSILSIQRLIAQNMHRARPQPNPDAILLYAKGDYLQYALPSVLSIFGNLKMPAAHLLIPKLLDAPVSLQKHGIRFAFKRLDQEELKKVFLNCWNTSKNASIRALIYKYTHTLLCNEKDDAKANSLWELLDIFIDNLSFNEDKEIYKLFSEVEKIPLNIRANYIVKSYNFLQTLIPKLHESDRSHYVWITSELAGHSRVVMETISLDFVTTIIQEFIDKKFFNSDSQLVGTIYQSDSILKVLSAYLLCSKNVNDQMKKYESVFVPLMQQSIEKWGEKSKGVYYVRKNFEQLLIRLAYDLKDYVAEKNMLIPLKMFTLILIELENSLPIIENYMILTKWKLTVAMAKLAEEYTYSKDNKIIPLEFGKICLNQLKNDVMLHFPCIYVLFSLCVKQLINVLIREDLKLEFFNGLLSDCDFIQGYLSTIEIGLEYRGYENYAQLWKQIETHPSVEVKMHYYNKIAEDKM